MNPYEHSEVFASLKSIKERLADNLTTPQYLQGLDLLIHGALTPILLTTNSFDTLLAYLIGWQETNRKRKVSMLELQEFIQLALAWNLLPTREERADQVHRLRLDRGALFWFIRQFVTDLQLYADACHGTLKDSRGRPVSDFEQLAFKKRVEASLDSDGSLLSTYYEAKFWLAHAEDFKSMIFEKFIRLCLQTAQSDYANPKIFDRAVRLDDLIQAYILAALRALDKCDQQQGVLTNHIKNWLYTARAQQKKSMQAPGSQASVYTVEVGEATTPNDEVASAENQLEAAEAIEHVRQIAHLMDPEGYGRAFLGITESTELIRGGFVVSC